MRLLAACLAVAFGAALTAAAAPVPQGKEKTTAEKLVGKWELVRSSNGTPDGVTAVVEFTKDGKMTVTFTPKEKGTETIVLKGKFKADGDKIDYTLEDGSGGMKQEILTVKKLTDDELVTTDPDNVKEEFKRAAEKKGEKKPVKD
jgi:uncharacterized protein (TIGR03066 family)